MFYLVPTMGILAVYVLAAVLPAIFLMRYIYRQDTVEKEPGGLLVSLIFMGVLAALAAIVLEGVAQSALDTVVGRNSPVYTILLAFLVVAVVEEGTKLFFLKKRTWRSPHFNFRFDGVVYSVFVSLGFAAFENIQYVFRYGMSVVVPRALLAIPGHMGFAVFMGVFYGRAKLCENYGDHAGKKLNLGAGYLMAVVLHGFYDTCAMLGSARAMAVFLTFVVVMYFVVIRLIRRESRMDAPV